METGIAQLTNNGANLENLIGWTINFNNSQPVSTGNWSNVTATLPAYVFVPGEIVSIGKGQLGYYATWQQSGKTCGVIFQSLDDILDYKGADLVSLFLQQTGIFQDCYKWLYEGTKPVKEIVQKAVDAGKAIVSGAAKTITTTFDIAKFLGDALPLIVFGGLTWWILRPAKKTRYAN